jgi:hypothetical protein
MRTRMRRSDLVNTVMPFSIQPSVTMTPEKNKVCPCGRKDHGVD